MVEYKVRHLKRGTTYTVIGRAELQSGFDCAEGQPLVVYQGVDGKLWARPVQEFHDGRFVTQESPHD